MKLIPKIDLDNNDRGRSIWFMSDLHYNHENILKLNSDSRPFTSIQNMNIDILYQMKKTIKPGDILFDLGDLIWKENNETIELFKSILPERSYKVMGNHDSQQNYYMGGWGKAWRHVLDVLDIQVKYKGEDIQLTLSHYPILDWNHHFRGSIMLHGHTHGHLDKLNQGSGELRLDVGYDADFARNYGSFLIPFEEIYNWGKKITGGQTFRDWAKNNVRFREN